jgi:uncharacterized membrane protein YbaN (DUF454 family)
LLYYLFELRFLLLVLLFFKRGLKRLKGRLADTEE